MRTILILPVLFLFISFNGNAQALSKSAKKKIRHKAENYFDMGDYNNALLKFNELYAADSLDPYVNYHIGVCKFQLRRYRHQALRHFEHANSKISPEYYYYIGLLHHLNGQFELAETELQIYQALGVDKEFEEDWIAQLLHNVNSAREMINTPVNAEVKTVGDVINTSYSEYVPLISADGQRMFFTSRRPGSTGGQVDQLGDVYEDVYVSLNVGGEWQEPIQLPSPVNTATHDACVGLTAEGENLLLYRTNANLVGGDIYISSFDGTNWRDPVLLDPVINSLEWAEPSACMGASGEIILFSSNRPGGMGGKDLYRVVKLPNGKWSEAQNLGPDINTPFDEDAPFLNPEGTKLYFSSQGHKNMGGYDVFRCDIDSAGKWSRPVNIGSPINTVDDDIYFVISADESRGYYSSVHKDGMGGTDIYEIKFTDAASGVQVRDGYLFNKKGEPLKGKVTLFNNTDFKMGGVYKTNGLTGKFILVMDPEKEYEIIVESEGYHPHTQTIYYEEGEIHFELTKKE